MNTDEIHALSDEELDAAIAEGLGNPPPWKHDMTDCGDPYYDYCRRCGAKGPDVYGWENDANKVCPAAPAYSSSFDLCRAAEERLAEMGLGEFWVACLRRVVLRARDKDVKPRKTPIWYIAHATARQRAEAILLAMQKEGE